MKELTIEQKAKRYDEALKRARKGYKTHESFNGFREMLLRIFPELEEPEKKPNGGIVLEDFNEGDGFYKVNLAYLSKEQVEEIESIVKEWNRHSSESEDEKIRKALIKHFNVYTSYTELSDGVTAGDCVAWLEKQESVGEIVERCKDSWYNEGKLQGKIEGLSDEEKYQQGWHDALEKQGEQKPIEWSEEDSVRLQRIIDFLWYNRKGGTDTIYQQEQDIDWLKSLKDRVQPKQSNKPQGKTALETVKEEKVDNANKVEPKFKVGDIVQYITDSTDRRKIEEVDTLCNMYHTDSSPIMFEIEDEWKVVVNAEDVEQNPTDKIESMFKVGDWVVRKDGGVFDNDIKFAQITEIDGEKHWFDTGLICLKAEDMRLWTIEDAKDGDVLVASDGSIFLFKGAIGRACKHYVALTADGVVVINEGLEHFWETSTAVHSATKEQCDTLMKAMTDAEYTFDFEKKELKELKKVEQK